MKKLLLLALPVLMVLSGCNPLSSYAAAGTKVDLFAEDTLAHEELFGEANSLQPRMLGNPEEDPDAGSGFTLTPKVGVQFFPYIKDEADLLAVRYVAAIASTDLASDGITATWTRGVSEKNSNQIKAMSGGHESTVLYASLNNGGTPKSATSEGAGYNRYVVYTLYDIPVAQSSSYIAAYLTLSKEGETDVESRTVISRLDGGHYFSVNRSSDLKKDGFFLQSSRAGIIPQNKDAETYGDSETENHAEFTSISFAENEKFGLFRLTASKFQFFGYDAFVDDPINHSASAYIKSTSIDQYGEMRISGSYTFYINKYNLIYASPVHVTTTLYFVPNDSWKTGSSFFEVWANEWVSMTNEGNGVYSAQVDVGANTTLNFCRMNPTQYSGDGKDWVDSNGYRVWNQTQNVSINRDFASLLNNPKYVLNSDNQNWDYFTGYWTSL